MSFEIDSPFQPLEPPPGGLARLRARLDEKPRRRPWALALLAPAAACAALLLVPRASGPEAELRAALHRGGSPAAIRLGLAPRPREPVSLTAPGSRAVGLTRIGPEGSAVALYLVDSVLPTPDPDAS